LRDNDGILRDWLDPICCHYPSMADLNALTDWDKLKSMLDKKSSANDGTRIDEAALAAHLKTRVKGQDAVVDDVARLLRLQMGKRQRGRPICNLLFLGPTGTGKTELAKAIAEFLYHDEKAMLRFDCSEFSGPEAKTRLIGSPQGYVGSEAGGQLIRPILSNPKKLILFDEIEKSHKDVFDLFLQLMGEARLTEQGSGRTGDFSETIIILTSNANAEQIGRIQAEITDPHERINAVKSYLADANVFRTEILGRIDRVYVFQPLQGFVIAEIALVKITKLASEYGLEVEFVAPELIIQALTANEKVSRFGIRELERILFDMFADPMEKMKDGGFRKIRVETSETGEIKFLPVVL
jgi:ATP-dependent Clp protease ATP-binding subunit ClpA